MYTAADTAGHRHRHRIRKLKIDDFFVSPAFVFCFLSTHTENRGSQLKTRATAAAGRAAPAPAAGGDTNLNGCDRVDWGDGEQHAELPARRFPGEPAPRGGEPSRAPGESHH